MGIARAVVFAGVAFFPAVLLGLGLFILLGGADKPFANWMWIPCWILPPVLMLGAGIRGYHWQDVELE